MSRARCALGLLLTLCALGCRGSAGPTGRVVVLGVDGLHLPMLDQLVAAGELPNFGRLYREGTVGPLSTVQGGLPSLSARIWTTFATGVVPAEHGVTAFTYKDPQVGERLSSSRERSKAAVWEIASAAGRRVGIVNWIVSYPADPVNGFMITERYLPLPSKLLAQWRRVPYDLDPQRVVYPPELVRTLLDLKLRPQHPSTATAENGEDNDANVFTMTAAALERYPVDLLMVYTRTVDELSHLWWHTHEPQPGDPPGPDVVDDYLHRFDRLLGAFLSRLAPEDRLLLLSDHGMERNAKTGGMSGQHQTERVAVGVQIWWGPGVPAGRRLSASLLDVAPTLLEMLAIPPSDVMPGRVLTEVLPADHELLARHVGPYPRPIDTNTAVTTEADPEILKRLRALGYIQ